MKETDSIAKAKEQMESLKGEEFPVRGLSGLGQRRWGSSDSSKQLLE